MTRQEFLIRLLLLIGAGLIIGVLFRFGLGEQAFRLYALPVAILVTLPMLGSAMKYRMQSLGDKPRWRYWLLVPLGLLALVRIGYWLAFFTNPDLATLMHVAFNQVSLLAGPLLRIPELVTLAIGFLFFVRLALFKGASKS